MIKQVFTAKLKQVNEYIEGYFAQFDLSQHSAIQQLKDSMRYSALGSGKRFRPILSLLVADALGKRAEDILPFCLSLELVHTYSLIHDDLPAMDNDDERRGKPTNHKVFGEAVALLAGDALLTEAFLVLAENYAADANLLSALVKNISTYAGIRGMMGGQAIDLAAQKESVQPLPSDLAELHSLKTGALIVGAVSAAALICKASPKQSEEIKHYAENLGLAFSLADDLLDYNDNHDERGSFPSVYGFTDSKKLLAKLTENAISSIKEWDAKADPLRWLAQYNQSRDH